MHKQDSIGMKLCSLLVICLACLSVDVEAGALSTAVERTISVASVVTGTSPSPACGPVSYVWPITFNEAGRGGVVFTIENVPTKSVVKTRITPRYNSWAWNTWYYTETYTVQEPSKTLNDITIGISTRATTQGDPSAVDPFIEIVLGGWSNTRSVIRRARQGTELLALEHDKDRVVPGRTYWVSLDNNRVRVGTGSQINTNTFMDVNLVSTNVIRSGDTFLGKYVGFACWNTPLTYNAVSLVSDCTVSEFDAGTQCSTQCGGGTLTRRRTITNDVSGQEFGAKACPSLTQDQSCNTQPCPIDCVMNEWGAWGACSNDCTCEGCPNGLARRTRTQKTPPSNGGSNCPVSFDQKECNTQPCPIDCVASEWSDFDACSQKCGGTGVHTRTKTIIKPAQFGGKDCPASSLQDVAPCNTQPCPIDCVMTDWSGWTDCSRPCGTGTQQRARDVTTRPDFGGVVCGDVIQEQECNKQDCPTDCELSEWSAWGKCDSDCGSGTYTRTRTIKKAPTAGGTPCGPTTDEGACNTQECPVDKLAVLIKRIRHLELQDRVSSLEETAVKQAQDSVSKTAFNLAAAAATPVSTISLKETVTHGHQAQAHAEVQFQLSQSQQLAQLHPALVMAAHPYTRPAITQLLASEILVDELAKWAERQDAIERAAGKR